MIRIGCPQAGTRECLFRVIGDNNLKLLLINIITTYLKKYKRFLGIYLTNVP